MAVYLTKSLLDRISSKRNSTCSNSDDGEKVTWSNNNLEMKHGDDQPNDMICRVCSGSGCTYLLTKLDDDYDVIAALKSVTNLSVSIEDSLPNYICDLCLDMLKISLKFKKTCVASDRSFRRKLKLTEDPLLHSYPYSKHDFHSILHKMKMKRLRLEAAKEKRRKTIKKEKAEIKPKEFRCTSCDVAFDNKESLTEHRRERQCMRRACDVCGQLVISITQHMKQVHKDEMPHKCSTCGKGFSIIARLKSHMLVHTDTFNFFCDICPYKSKHKYYLVMHMRTHTGEKPYKCPHCPSTFVNPSNLNKHKLIHQDKRFTCSFCQKTFRMMSTLREHTEATHMNIKHTCHYCGKEFCYKSDLRKHEVNAHKREKRGIGGEPTYKQIERLQRMKDKWHVDDAIAPTNQHGGQDPLSVESRTELTTALPTSQFGDTSQTMTSQVLTSQVVTSQLLTSIPQPLLHSTYKVESSGAEVHPVSDYMIYFTDETGVLHQQPTTISIQQPTEIIMSNVPVKDEVKLYPGPHQGISFYQ